MKIIVRGQPAPQGSKRGFVNPKTNRVIVVEQLDARIKSWRDSVRYAAVEARDGGLPITGPVSVRMVFTFVRPRSHYRTGKNAHLLRDTAPARPCTPPDLSKLARSTEDALTDARVWEDDSRAVEYFRLAKVYAGEDPEALDSVGAIITVLPFSAVAVTPVLS